MNSLNEVRFKSDKPRKESSTQVCDADSQLIHEFLHTCVLIRPETFPRLSQIISTTFENLNQSPKKYSFFLQNSIEMQAMCIRSSTSSLPIFLLTSSIVERLNDVELMFVIGHEFAHYYYMHESDRESKSPIADLRNQMLSRAAEISADRMGLMACRNLSAATSVIIKLATGLNEKNVKFNIAAFLKQYQQLKKHGPSQLESLSSHPLFLIRLRALVLFSRTRQFFNKQLDGEVCNQISLSDVDEILINDFNKLSGMSLNNIENTLVKHTLLLGAFLVFANDGRISKDEQEFLSQHFDVTDFSEIMDMLKMNGLDGLACEFEARLNDILNSNIDDSHKKALMHFIGYLIERFGEEDTERLRMIVNAQKNYYNS